MKAKDQLRSLLRIQELVLEIREAQQVVDAAPGRIDEIEERFRERNAEYVAVKERNDELQRDQRARSSELTTLEERRQKFMDDLMQVKNQREYAAMLKEIDTVKALIADHEEAILTDMEEIEKLREELRNFEAHIAEERERVASERVDVEAAADAAQRKIESRSAERERVEADLPDSMQMTARQLEQRRQGIFLARAENGTCQCCYVRIRPQVFQEIRTAAVVHTCDSCKRFLYHEASLRSEKGGGGSAERPNGVEAVNGGAV